MIANSPPRAMKGAFQPNLRASPPDPSPPMMVAAGVPMKKDEKTIFLRREFSGYTRLKIPRAIGIFAAQATPVRPERTSRTTPVCENEVLAVSKAKADRLITRSVLRGSTPHVSAIWPNGRRKAPVVKPELAVDQASSAGDILSASAIGEVTTTIDRWRKTGLAAARAIRAINRHS